MLAGDHEMSPQHTLRPANRLAGRPAGQSCRQVHNNVRWICRSHQRSCRLPQKILEDATLRQAGHVQHTQCGVLGAAEASYMRQSLVRRIHQRAMGWEAGGRELHWRKRDQGRGWKARPAHPFIPPDGAVVTASDGARPPSACAPSKPPTHTASMAAMGFELGPAALLLLACRSSYHISKANTGSDNMHGPTVLSADPISSSECTGQCHPFSDGISGMWDVAHAPIEP